MSETITAEDIALHLRLLAGDKTAPDECVTRWLPELVRVLAGRNKEIAEADDAFILAAAHDALMDYTANPGKYDPNRSSLRSYLLMLAQGDLRNALQRERTQNRDAWPIDALETWLHDRNDNFESDVIDRVDASAAWQRVMQKITDPLDRRMLSLMLQGERATATFAKLLNIDHMPEQEQQKIVKRHKDRISKRLERLRYR